MPGDRVQNVARGQQNSCKNKSYQNDVKAHDDGHSNMAWVCRSPDFGGSLRQAMATIYLIRSSALDECAYLVPSAMDLLVHLN